MAFFVIFLLLIVFTVLATAFTMIFVARKLGKFVASGLSVSSLPRSVAASLQESRRYGRLIMRTAQQYPPGPLRDRLNLTLQPVERWLDNLTRLEEALKKLYTQRNLTRELRQTGFEIEELRRRLLTASDGESASLRALMSSKKQHLAVLQELQSFQKQAELKIRKIASDLAVTHAEMLLLIARGDFNENRFRRLDENLQEHLSSMRDMLGAMEDLGYQSAAG